MASAADLAIKITANIDQAAKGIDQLKRQLEGFGAGAVSKVDSLTASLQKAQPAGIALAAAGGAITAGMAGAVGTAASFEKEMSAIKSLMAPGDVQAYSGAVHDLALALGRDTTFSAGQAAQGIEELVKAGVPIPAILGGAAKAALDLAAATSIPVPQAANFAATAMNAFHKSAAELPAVMDTLAGTANASAADMNDLAFAFQAVGSVAPLVGMSFEDTATAIGLFANNGLRGSDAGTSLKTMLAGLIPKTDKAYETMKALGIITETGANKFFDAQGKFIGLAGAADVLQKALGSMTPQQQMESLYKMFGSDAIRAGGILLREGAAGVNALAAAIGQTTVADAAAVRLDNLIGALEALNGSIETVTILIGENFLPPLRFLTGQVTTLVNAFASLPGPAQAVVGGLLAVAGVVMLLVGGLVLAGPLLLGLPAAFGAIGAAAAVAGGVVAGLAGVVGALALPLLAVVGVVAALYLAWTTNFLGIQQVTGAVWAWLQGMFGQLRAWLQTNLPAAVQALSGVFQTVLLPVLGAVWSFVSTLLVPLLLSLANVVTAVLELAVRALAGVFQGILLPILGDVWNSLTTALMPAIQSLADNFLTPLVNLIGGAVTAAFNALSGLAGSLTGAINGIGGAISGVIGWLNRLAETIRGIQLPSWMQPGSPTPWELGLRGVAAALGDVDRAWGAFSAGLPAATFNGMATAGVGAGGGGGTVNISGPLVQIDGVTVTGEGDEDRLVTKIRDMLMQDLQQAVGQSTRFPVGLGAR